MALRRAHASLCQHAQALARESQPLDALIRQAEEQALSPEFLADELASLGLAGGGAYLLMRTARVKFQPAVRSMTFLNTLC